MVAFQCWRPSRCISWIRDCGFTLTRVNGQAMTWFLWLFGACYIQNFIELPIISPGALKSERSKNKTWPIHFYRSVFYIYVNIYDRVWSYILVGYGYNFFLFFIGNTWAKIYYSWRKRKNNMYYLLIVFTFSSIM